MLQVRVFAGTTAICMANQVSHNITERRWDKSKRTRSYVGIFVEDGTCIREQHIFLSSNDTNDSLTLYLAQQLINQSNSENLVTVAHRNVIANSRRYVTGLSTHE